MCKSLGKSEKFFLDSWILSAYALRLSMKHSLYYEKHFKVSHNKESHKVEVSAKDSFEYNRIKYIQGEGEGKEKRFLFPMKVMGPKTPPRVFLRQIAYTVRAIKLKYLHMFLTSKKLTPC
jgi:hypothetical protein